MFLQDWVQISTLTLALMDHISLDSNFAEYFEGYSQVIVKGRLKANISKYWCL